MICSIIFAAADRCSKEMGAATDSEDVTCAVSIIRGLGAACVEIQDAAIKTASKEADQ